MTSAPWTSGTSTSPTVGAELLAARWALVEELRPHVAAAYADLAGGTTEAGLAYRSSVPLPDGRRGRATRCRSGRCCTAAMLAELGRLRSAELDRGISLVGPHRDELELLPRRGPRPWLRVARGVLVARAGAAVRRVRAPALGRRGPGAGAGRRLRRARHRAPGPARVPGRGRRPGADHRGRGRRRAGDPGRRAPVRRRRRGDRSSTEVPGWGARAGSTANQGLSDA